RPVHQLRGADRRDRHIVVALGVDDSVEIDLAALGGDEHAGVDQRSHGFCGTLGRLAASIPSSTKRSICSSSFGAFFMKAASRRSVILGTTVTGPICATGRPCRSMMYVTPSSRTRSTRVPKFFAAVVAGRRLAAAISVYYVQYGYGAIFFYVTRD